MRNQLNSSDATQVTRLLQAWTDGDEQAGEELIPLVYTHLREIAGRCLQGERPSTLQPTVLVHEAYFRLLDQNRIRWQDRSHFFAVSAQLMRRILIDHVRRYKYLKRGGDRRRVTMDHAIELSAERASELVALDDALTDLAAVDPEKAAVVELRYFGGLSLDQTAEVVGRSRATVVRQWSMAKAWLFRELTEQPCHEG